MRRSTPTLALPQPRGWSHTDPLLVQVEEERPGPTEEVPPKISDEELRPGGAVAKRVAQPELTEFAKQPGGEVGGYLATHDGRQA